MAKTFFFYDLETSGFNPRSDRIMQFGGQRTDMNLKPIGEPVNILIKMSPDTLPSPDAIMVTGITPQKTIQEGITEAEFAKIFTENIAEKDTIFIGFNSIRFDDEFMRFFLYRNYVDAYEWQWKDGRSRWDLLDVVRMTRALRPEGINWPVDVEGKPGNRLEMLTSINKLDHEEAHDALSDVLATISLAKLIKQRQPKLFNYLLEMREKKKVIELVGSSQPFVYTSGKYPGEYEKTTVVTTLFTNSKKQGVLVYDLRIDPSKYINLSAEEIVEAWKYNPDPESTPFPVKTLRFNRCPAIAPIGVLDAKTKKRLKLKDELIDKHQKILNENSDQFIKNLQKALEIMDKQQQTRLLEDESTVDELLYSEFINDADRVIQARIQKCAPEELSAIAEKLQDKRLKAMMPLYKGRNFPKYLTENERKIWDEYQKVRLSKQVNQYFERIDAISADAKISGEKRYTLEELKLYGESILPADAG